MPEPSQKAAPVPKESEAPAISAWRVYGRLVSNAWRYKTRLLVSLAFAVLIAASFTTMLVTLGTVVKLTFYDPAAVAAAQAEGRQLDKEDPRDKTAEDIRKTAAKIESVIGWAPRGVDAWFISKVDSMRANKMNAIVNVCIIVVILALISGIARFLQEYFAGAIGANISTDLAKEMYENLMRQSVGFFEKSSSGEILSRFTNDIFQVNRGLTGVLVKLMREPIKAVMFFGYALSKDVPLTLVGVCGLPLVAFVLMRIGKKVRKSVRRSLQKISSMASVVNETITGITIVKGYNMEAYETARVQKEITKLRRYLFQMVKLNAITDPVAEFILVVGVSVFVYIGGLRVVRGDLDPVALTELFLALAMMLDPMRKLASVNNMIQTSIASAQRIFDFIDRKADIVEVPEPVELKPFRDSVCFENVCFSYDTGAPVLDGITLKIKKGEIVALVGPSGAGKSTLVKLLPRFFDVTGGVITIDGVDIRRASFGSLRNQIGIVTQNTILFAETIADNIAYGISEYSRERIESAACAANADEFIRRLPQGYDTMADEAGTNLSGGQRQRLAIARAFIKDPAILILDEATSSLDSESERLIQDALDQFVEGRTALIIAHRLSTIQRADRILVMDQGRIIQEGTHDELLTAGGLYKRLYETQFGLRQATA